MTTTRPARLEALSRREAPKLVRRYGKIGISAVAAALPYQSEAKNPAYAPVTVQLVRVLEQRTEPTA